MNDQTMIRRRIAVLDSYGEIEDSIEVNYRGAYHPSGNALPAPPIRLVAIELDLVECDECGEYWPATEVAWRCKTEAVCAGCRRITGESGADDA